MTMKIIGRIEKIENITSIIVEQRGISGRLELHDPFEELADGQVVHLDISVQPAPTPEDTRGVHVNVQFATRGSVTNHAMTWADAETAAKSQTTLGELFRRMAAPTLQPHLDRTYSPGGPLLAEELQDEKRKQRIKAAVAAAMTR